MIHWTYGTVAPNPFGMTVWNWNASTVEVALVTGPARVVASKVYHPGVQAQRVFHPGVQAQKVMQS